MEKSMKKNIILIITVLFIGMGIAGGTYAWFSIAVNVTNGNYVTNTHCFDITYTDNTDQITGTLFPSGSAGGGLSGSISFKRSTSCATNGRGTFYLHVNSGISNVLTSTVAPHCENKYTLETIGGYNYFDCTNNSDNAIWVTNGTALRYALYDSTSRTNLYAVGYIDSSFVGQDKVIHTDFSINNTQKTYYLYIWLDGYTSDDTYNNLSFGATSRLSALQTKSTDTTFAGDNYTEITSSMTQYNSSLFDPQFNNTYQIVDYIRSTGTQYIDTGYYLSSNNINIKTKVYTANMPSTEQDIVSNQDGSTSRFVLGLFGYYVFGYSRYSGGTDTNVKSSNYNGEATLTIEMDYNYSNRLKTLTVNGSTYSQTQNATISNSNQTVKLFKAGNSNTLYFTGRMYYFTLYVDGGLVKNLVPCKRISDNKPGLYDTVNGDFYTNAVVNGDNFELPPTT